MLLLFNQFLQRYGTRSPLYLANPPITSQDEVSLPRFSVIHHLDLTADNHFPERSSYYFSSISDGKKIPIQSLTDLDRKEDTLSLNNKRLDAEIRKWQTENISIFRARDLLEVPNKDTGLISVFNYNTLKDLYNYQTSLTAGASKHKNLSTTYWNNVKKALDADKDSYQIVPLGLPSIIPNTMTLDRILSFSDVKVMRIVSDPKLLWIIEIYLWLTDSTREKSPLRSITDEESSRVIFEFKYKGFSSFVPLSLLRMVSVESELKSTMKLKADKVKKLFILSLLSIQKKIDSQFENIEDPKTPKVDEPEDFGDNNDDDEENKPAELSGITNPKEINISTYTKDKIIDVEKTIGDSFDETEEEKSLAALIDSVDEQDAMVSNFFEKKLANATKTVVDAVEEEEEISPIKTYSPEEAASLFDSVSSSDKIESYLETAMSSKTHSSAELRAIRKLKENRTLLRNPYTDKEQLDTYLANAPKDVALTKEVTSIPLKDSLVDEAFQSDVVGAFDRLYLKTLYHKDILACVANLEQGDVIIKDYEVEEVNTVTDRYETHKLTLKPIDGKESTIYFRLPKIDSEGVFMVSGNRYKLRKQRTDHPIRKISPIRVAITSNYGKLFLGRTERKTNDPNAYMIKVIQSDYLGEGNIVKKIVPGAKSLNKMKTPNIYNVLSSYFNELQLNTDTLVLNPKDAPNYITADVSEAIESKGYVFCGYRGNKNILVVGYDDVFYDYTAGITPIGKLEDLLEIDKDKMPKEFSTLKVLGDDIPLGVCMSYYLGLSGLIAGTGTEYQLLGPRQQYKPQSDELVLRFIDHKLVLKTDTIEKKLLFNGFLFYKDFNKQNTLSSYDSQDVYLNMFEFRNCGLIHLKELSSLRDRFLDPITRDVLESLGEPTEFLKVLMKANKLLEDYNHPDVNDPNYSRIRGYDRVPGLMYRALAESIREYKLRGRSGGKISLDPYKVWNYVTQDNTGKACEDINPILNLKEAEAVTFTGMDGLNKDATPKEIRRYHLNDPGLISESTVDSSDVALNIYLSPYAKLKSVRGLVDTANQDHMKDKAKIFSSAVQIAPMSEYDDPKRRNFVGVQYSHTIPSDGYRQPIMRTEYEYVIPYKVGALYSVMAKEDGVVTSLTEKLISIKYKSGEIASYKLGTQYGRMEGSVYPHEIITDLKDGSKFKEGEPICYNKNFFERDWLDSTKLITKHNRMVTLALTMNSEVFEDSSAISRDFASSMTTAIVKEKIFVIDFKTNIINLLPVGTKVDPNTVLFTGVDDAGDHVNLSESTIAMLQNLASLSPRSKVDGVIDRYEIKYNGDISDMSPSLRKIAAKLDRDLIDETKGTDYESTSNKVNSEYRSEGKNLNLDTLELKVFIRVPLRMISGDKGVFANQMKSVVSNVYTYKIKTESGDTVDAMFSYRGIINRVVNSPILMGTTNRIVRHIGLQVADLYFG